MNEFRYEIGTKLIIEFEIVDIDTDSQPYWIRSTVKDSDGDPILGYWVSTETFDKLAEASNPELARKRKEARIVALEDQLVKLKQEIGAE